MQASPRRWPTGGQCGGEGSFAIPEDVRLDKLPHRARREHGDGVEVSIEPRQREMVEIIFPGRSFGERGAEQSERSAEPGITEEAQIASPVVHDIAVIA